MKLMSTSLIMLLISVFSAILGLLRETLLAKYFGISREMEAFVIASFLPLVVLPAIGKALTTSFIPVYLNLKEESESKALKFYEQVKKCISFLGIVSMIVLGIGSILYVYGIGEFQNSSMNDLLLYMILILLPTILMFNIHGIERGRHQAENSYLFPSISNLFINVFFIVSIIFGAYFNDIRYLCYGLLVASFSQMYLLLKTKRTRLHTTVREKWWRSQGVRRFWGFFFPAILSSIAPTIPMLLARFLTGNFREGALVSLNYAFTIASLPILLLAMSSFSILYTLFSKSFVSKEFKKIGIQLNNSISFLTIVLIPSTVFVIYFSEEIIRVLFERGAFDERATLLTAASLNIFILGLYPTAIRELLLRFCFATSNKRTPFISSVILLITSMAFTVLFCLEFNQYGVPWAIFIANIITVVYMFTKNKEYMSYSLIWTLIKKLIFILMISIVNILLVKNLIENSWLLKSGPIVILICSMLLYFTFYIVSLCIFKNKEIMLVLKTLRSKIKKN
ncbi:lipid II flippase MurJ [Bacillus hominis]|uniref:Lipid II flippase MurJ n=1 Tax=Bacillus hominis TaxID=2817478 RepID=A0ABT7REG5_9BACI|nr:lipid II flippase MurJ [Bacillus hominis]MDM5441340.1 lipid II flippase MurJ [Bacillus hominis]